METTCLLVQNTKFYGEVGLSIRTNYKIWKKENVEGNVEGNLKSCMASAKPGNLTYSDESEHCSSICKII